MANRIPAAAVALLAASVPVALAWANSNSLRKPGAPPKSGKPAKPAGAPTLASRYAADVKPVLKRNCAPCHAGANPAAQFDLGKYPTLESVTAHLDHWTLTRERVAANEMPPAGSKQPSAKEREIVLDWIQDVRAVEIARTAGDPGPVLARRLSNSEYNYTIRDLTGVDLRPAAAFPVDPANQEGFDNSGESLTLSPALAKKYYEAARSVADNLVLTSTGFAFATHPVLSEPDRDKFCVLRIVDFYRRQPVDIADYLIGAWRYRHRSALGTPGATVDSIAKDMRISPKYLRTVDALLSARTHQVGPVARLRETFEAVPAPSKPGENAPVERFREIANWVRSTRRRVAVKIPNLQVPPEFTTGSYTNVLWKDHEYAANRRRFDPRLLAVGSDDPDIGVPRDEAARAPYMASFAEFASVFPDTFFIDERGLMEHDDQYGRSGRFLTGGTHNATSFFRDDAPLVDLVLSDDDRKTLDTLWRDFAVVASFNERMYLQGIFYERNEAQTILVTRDPEFNFAKSEDRSCANRAGIAKFKELYLAKATRKGGKPETLAAYATYFDRAIAGIEAEGKERKAAEPRQREAMLAFAQKAWRRPLSTVEKSELMATYSLLRAKEGLTHEDAIRDSVVRILLSPRFLYRADSVASDRESVRTGFTLASNATIAAPAPPGKVVPLSGYALASRLSYFLWSSLPDDELLKLAASGNLQRPEVLVAQARRMVRDPRARALATEFGGNWLDFRRFEEHNAVDRERFPQFDDALRSAMFEEPVRYLLDLFQSNRPVLDLLYGKHTFVNGALGRHYGFGAAPTRDDVWVRIDNADSMGRGGLLPMAVFLTQNASGLRTSPVKRGYWVVRRVLGERIPPPPPMVPELPKDERQMDRPLRQMLAAHRDNPACSGCHARFDSYGLVFENFGPIGERRDRDMGGKPVDASAPFPGGVEKTGVAGLRELLRDKRQADFLDNFNRKLLSYALGRTLLPSDEPLLETLRRKNSSGDGRVGTLIDTIVASKQFRLRRASATGGI